MKFKTTKKEIMNGYRDIICVGYCNLQNMLNTENPIAYTTRAEGWGSDIYEFGNIAIVTGYAPFGNIRPNYDIQKKYDDMAEKIVYDYSIQWADRKIKLLNLIEQFISEIVK